MFCVQHHARRAPTLCVSEIKNSDYLSGVFAQNVYCSPRGEGPSDRTWVGDLRGRTRQPRWLRCRQPWAGYKCWASLRRVCWSSTVSSRTGTTWRKSGIAHSTTISRLCLKTIPFWSRKLLWTCRQIQLARDFLDTFILVHTSHCGSRCRATCLHKTCSSTCHHTFEWLLFPCFVFFFLSLVPLRFLLLLPVLCPELSTSMWSRPPSIKTQCAPAKMRSIALWRYTTLSQVMSPTRQPSSTTSTTQRLLQRSSRMNPSILTLYRRTRAMRSSTMSLSEKRNLHHCSIRSEKNQRTWDQT